MRKKLVIVQPYVPEYRVAFFTRLIAELARVGIDCVIAAGEPVGSAASRGDSADAPWIVRIPTRSVKVGSRRLTLGGSRTAWKDADAVIVGHLGSSLDTYLALWDSVRDKRRTAVWGHIRSFIGPPNQIDVLLERWQLRHSDHVFAYTPSGADYAAEAGVDPARITTIMNTIDTDSLYEAVLELGGEEVERFGTRHHLVAGRVVAYIGAIDSTKRIGFLVAALDELWVRRPDVRVLIGGSGEDEFRFEDAVARGQAILLGYVDDLAKALIGKWASALLVPGRVGLIAVDALVLGVPVISTDWPFHAPEAEYLERGVTRFDAPDEPARYAAFVDDFLSSTRTHASQHDYPSIDGMVERFLRGVLTLMEDRSRNE